MILLSIFQKMGVNQDIVKQYLLIKILNKDFNLDELEEKMKYYIIKSHSNIDK